MAWLQRGMGTPANAHTQSKFSPVRQSKVEPCQGHMIVDAESVARAIENPRCGQA